MAHWEWQIRTPRGSPFPRTGKPTDSQLRQMRRDGATGFALEGLRNSMNSRTVRPLSLSVVVPAYNEESTIAEIIARLLAIEADEIVVVDDCSSDATAAIAGRLAAEHPRVKVAHHRVNRGKTEAVKTGFQLTTGQIVIVQDADLEYDPEEIAEVIAPIVEGRADVVYGSRFLVRKAARVLYFYHYLANKGLTFLSNLCTNVNMTDVETCYKAFRGDIIRNMKITSQGFGFEIEVTANVAKLGVAIYEVPISYHGRTYEQGKKIGVKDAFAALWYILRFNFLCSLEDSFSSLPEVAAMHPSAARTSTS
jgi:glycosyltransferase involved in cell wall biosynthesis